MASGNGLEEEWIGGIRGWDGNRFSKKGEEEKLGGCHVSVLHLGHGVEGLGDCREEFRGDGGEYLTL